MMATIDEIYLENCVKDLLLLWLQEHIAFLLFFTTIYDIYSCWEKAFF